MYSSIFRRCSPTNPRRELSRVFSAGFLILHAAFGADPTPPPLTLDAAYHLAIEADPQLRVFAAGLEAATAEAEQAGVRPNPTVGFEAENVLGTGPFSGIDGMEITLGLRQTIETAGKREKRVALAEAMGDTIRSAQMERLTAVRSAVQREFVSTLLARESLQLQESLLDLIEQSEQATANLVDSARAPQVDFTRARLAVKQQQFVVDQSVRNLKAAKVRLNALLGVDESANFDLVGTIALEADLPDLPSLLASLPNTAMLLRFDAEARQREAALELEQSRARSNFDVFAGARYHNEPGDGALVAGIEIPWTLFDRNQGAISAAEVRLRAVEHERATVRRGLRLEITRIYQDMLGAHAEAQSAIDDLMPAAEETLAETERGFERGLFSQLRVIEARETLFNVRTIYFDALTRFAEAQAAIESLTMPAPQPSH